ncbi:MAG: hypothetical protein ABI947_24710 [Chloroflexota bacterium]
MISDTLRGWPRYSTRTVVSAWRDETIRIPIIIFAALRVITGIAALLIVHVSPATLPAWLNGNPSGETYFVALPRSAPLASLVEPWHRYDTAWYIKIAIQGYRASDPAIVFPPLYPVAIRLIAPFVGGNYVLAALLISNTAGLIAFILLFKLIELEFGDLWLARRTLICLAAFPTAFYFVAGYTESIYLALTLGAFLATFKKNWLLASLLAALAGAVRLQGALLCLPLAWIAYVQLRECGLDAFLARLPAVLGSVVGTLSYMAYIEVNNLGSLEYAYAHQWKLFTRLPFDAIENFVTRYSRAQTFGFENDNALALIFIVVMAIIVTIKMRPAYSLYVWSTLAVILLRYHNGPQFESMFRYALLMFPCFIALGMVLSNQWVIMSYAIVSGQWLFILLNRFIHWIWVA